MRALVTGGAGFLGSHLVDRLIADGVEVVVIDNLKRGSLEHLRAHLDGGALEFVQLDIREEDRLVPAFRGVDFVYHLAAQSNVMGAFEDPDYSFQTNVIGTYNVLKAAHAAGVKHLVFSSSREVYGEPGQIPVNEELPVEPKNPYGASKLAGEAFCRVWNSTLGLPCTILRFGNLYGPRDSDRVIPIWLDRALRGETLVLYGGEQVLDFVWVGIAVEALVRASQCNDLGPINIANGHGTSLRELVALIRDVTSTDAQVSVQPARAAEVTRFVADIGRMQRLLNLNPEERPLSHLIELI